MHVIPANEDSEQYVDGNEMDVGEEQTGDIVSLKGGQQMASRASVSDNDVVATDLARQNQRQVDSTPTSSSIVQTGKTSNSSFFYFYNVVTLRYQRVRI